MRPPTRQQAAGADPSGSSWVTASAGTGKTRVLTDRVLRLLVGGARPEGILCLTFTRAAAAEMMVRVTDVLGHWASVEPKEVREELRLLMGTGHIPTGDEVATTRRLFASVLDAPGGLHIQTIHSFCESLLARFPLESRIPSHFQVMDERTAAEMLDAARNAVLTRSRADPTLDDAVSGVTRRINETQFADLMKAFNDNRSRLRTLLEQGADAAVASLRGRLGIGEGETTEEVLAEACAPEAGDEAGLRRVAAAMAGGSKADMSRAEVLSAWLDRDAESRLEMWGRILEFFFTKKGGVRNPLMTDGAGDAVAGGPKILEREAERLKDVNLRLNSVGVAESTEALLRFGDALLTEYDRAKSLHARLDYEDLILRARDLLRTEGIGPWVRYKLDGGIDHVLLDEAQDTSPEQWDVIDLLTREFFAGEGAHESPRTLFAVGDAKQSIYGFRRADPAMFAHWRERFGQAVQDADLPWRPVELIESFRSAIPVLEAVDAVFADPVAQKGLLFGNDSEVRHHARRNGQAGFVELWEPDSAAPDQEPSAWDVPAENGPRRSPSARLAERIAREVANWIGSEDLPSRGRPMTAGDVMILVQRRVVFVDEMIRALKQHNVPVAGTDRMIIADQLPVQDLMAVARFVLLPGDDLNLATVLKGPFLGVSEDALFDLAYEREGTLWRALQDRAAETPEFSAAVTALKDLLARADTVPPHTFFAELLAAGGRRCILTRLGHEASDPLDEFLARALEFERDHSPSLQGFLRWIEAGRAEVRRDLEVGRDEVRVLTVHGAKGLQAPVVILPDTVRAPNHDDLLLWDEQAKPAMLLWSHRVRNDDLTTHQARILARARRDNEYRRLLYVAMTRAEDRLIVCGWDTQKKRRSDCWYNLVASGLDRMRLVPEERTPGVRRWATPQTEEPDLPRDSGTAPATPPLPSWAHARAPADPSLPQFMSPSRPSGDELPAFSPLTGGESSGLRRGILIHRLLQLLPELSPQHRAVAAGRFLAAYQDEFSAAARSEMVQATLAALEEPEFAPLFGPGSRAEVPLSGAVGGAILTGQIDRLWVADDGILIVDYKTHRPAPRSASSVPLAYLRQMVAYRGALRAIYADRPVRCALLWTDGPRWMPLTEATLDGAQP
jgi:ATP-dependent helicase/nuclease subunit A